METSNKVDPTAVNGPDKELPTQEDTARRHVDALLDFSEEALMQELEPYEYHCYPGWEEAVRGWARVAPRACILLAQKTDKKTKHKETDNLIPLSVDPKIPDAGSSASTSKHYRESHVGLHNSLKKPMSLKQHAASWSHTAVGALQIDAAVQKTMSNTGLKDKMEKEAGLRETPSQPHHLTSKYSENRSTRPQKQRQRPNNAVAPIKNFTFLPPITSPLLNPKKVSGQFCTGINAPRGETIEEICFTFDKKSETRGTRVDPIDNPELHSYTAALTSKYQTHHHNPHFFSTGRVSVPKRYQVPMSSKPDTVHCTGFSVGKSRTQALYSGTAGGAQAHMHPSKTVCM